jgi:putative oxidoreductase
MKSNNTTARLDGLALIGRVLLSLIFIISGVAKLFGWNETLGYMNSQGLPVPQVLLAVATAIEIVCGVMLLVGYQTRIASAIVFVYLIPVTLVFHDFWSYQGQEAQSQMVDFLKNLAILGGLAHVWATGPGAISVDYRLNATRDRDVEDRGRLKAA